MQKCIQQVRAITTFLLLNFELLAGSKVMVHKLKRKDRYRMIPVQIGKFKQLP